MINEKKIRETINASPFGFANHEVIVDHDNKPVDYRFLEVNPAFERQTGLEAKKIIGKTVREVIPGIEKADFDWIGFYGKIAIEGGNETFEQFFEPLERWYKANVFSQEKGFFTTSFMDITAEKSISEVAARFSNMNAETIDLAYVADKIRKISGAKYAVMNKFDENGKDFTTIAFSGINHHIEKAASLLGMEIMGKKWSYDPVRQKKIEQNKTTVFNKISDLSEKVVSLKTIDVLCKTFNLGQAAVVKITKDEKMLADFTLVFTQDGCLQNRETVEIYADMTGMLISRIDEEIALKRARKELQIISDNMLDMVSIADLKGNYKFLSASHQILGYEIESLKNRNVLEFVHPDDQADVRQKINDLMKRQAKTEISIYRYRCADGKYLWFETLGTLLLDENGNPNEMLFNTRDISEKTATEKLLKQSDQLLKNLSKQIPGVIYQYRFYPDGKACFPFASEHIMDIYEVTPEDVQADSSIVMERLHPDDKERVVQKILNSKDSLEKWEDEYRVILPQKGEIWVRGIAQPELLNDGSVLWHGYIYDITETKKEQIETKRLKEQFELAVAGTNDGIWDWNLETNELFLSKRWKAMLGYEDKELKNEFNTFVSLIFAEDMERVNNFVQRYLMGEISEYSLEFRMKHKDGSLRWILAKGEAIRNYQGKPYRMAGSHSDITQKKDAESALLESKLRLELAMEAGEHGFWDWNLLTNETYFSPRYFTMLGYEDQELPMNFDTFNKLIHPDDKEAVTPVIQNSLKAGTPYSVEFRLICKDQSYLWVNGKGRVHLDEDKKAYRATGVHIDIHERKIAEEKLKESDLRFSVAIQGTEAGIWDWDMVNNRVVFSPQWKAMLGFGDAEIENSFEGWKNLWHPDDAAAIEKAVADHLNGISEKYEIIHRSRHKNGSWRWLMTRGKIIRDIAGKPFRWIGTNIDITPQKLAEEEMKIAKEQADAASRAKSEFLANMSHEIRTPLNGVIGFTELLKSTKLNQVQQQYVNNANVSGHTLLGIINDILDFSKIEAGMLELETVKTDMVELFENCVDIVKFATGKKDIEILLDIDKSMPRFAIVDTVRLKQILANLLGNAVKFTEKGEVELKVSFESSGRGQGKFSIAVRDTGIGISEVQKEKLFKAFSQADSSTTRKFGGTGLGLIISDMIAGKMGSKINISSKPGVGTTFFFDLTTSVEDGEKLDTAKIELIKRCLIIDDNANNRLILEHMLNQWQIECDSCENGFEALKRLETSRPFDVIICDYNMPYIDGLETIRMIREKLKLSAEKQPVILLHSSSEDIELHRKCKEMGVRFRLSKPVKSGDLFNSLCSLHQQNTEINQQVKNNKEDSTEKEGTPGKAKILIAEDVAINMILIKCIINNLFPGTEFYEAVNGLEVIKQYKTHDPDLVLMDVQMPELDGLEATAQIRKFEATTGKHIPIIALTAGALKGEKEKCLAVGMDDFLTKPVEPAKARIALEKFLWCKGNNSPASPGEVMEDEVHFGYIELSANLENNIQLLQEIISVAVEDIPRKIEMLDHACREKDAKRINEVAHSIKGASLSMRLWAMADIAGKIESNAGNNRLENLQVLLSELSNEWAIVKKILMKGSIK